MSIHRHTTLSHLMLSPLLILLILLAPAERGAAQSPADPRFGLVNAYEAGPQAVAASGAGWEVVLLRWDAIQPHAPTEWGIPPEVEEGLFEARAAGREVVGVLVGTPAWATDGQPGTGVPRGLYLPVNDPQNLWAAFVRQAVSYFAARGINRWVVWHNPDVPSGAVGSEWDGSLEDYYQLVKTAYLVARSANPNAQVHLGGVGYDPGWFARFLDVVLKDPTAPANNYYFDVATLHLYYSVEQIYTLMQNHFYVMQQKGLPLKEVWINETNARPAIDPQTYAAGKAFRQHANITLEQQAAFIVQAYALGFAANRGARIAVYRLVDNLEEDNGEAFGLLRADGSERPAFRAYQLVTREFSGFVYARRVSEETHPLIDYVRLTFEDKVTHVAWARTERNATLIIPARSEQATLLDLEGHRWLVRPQDGVYRVVVEGAECTDPQEGCLIGGAPWLLVEEEVPSALNETPPSVQVVEGGEPPTPDPAMLMTMTAQAQPTFTPTAAPSPSATPLPTSTPMPSLLPSPTDTSTPQASETPPPTATSVAPPSGESIQTPPPDLAALLPYLLIGLGILAIVAGLGYFLWPGIVRR